MFCISGTQNRMAKEDTFTQKVDFLAAMNLSGSALANVAPTGTHLCCFFFVLATKFHPLDFHAAFC